MYSNLNISKAKKKKTMIEIIILVSWLVRDMITLLGFLFWEALVLINGVIINIF